MASFLAVVVQERLQLVAVQSPEPQRRRRKGLVSSAASCNIRSLSLTSLAFVGLPHKRTFVLQLMLSCLPHLSWQQPSLWKALDAVQEVVLAVWAFCSRTMWVPSVGP